MNVEDLRPKPFKVTVKGVDLECKPLRMSHALSLAKIGNAFEDPGTKSREENKKLELEFDEVVSELVPDLAGVPLDLQSSMELIQQLMASVEPSESQELKENKVELPSSDPKA